MGGCMLKFKSRFFIFLLLSFFVFPEVVFSENQENNQISEFSISTDPSEIPFNPVVTQESSNNNSSSTVWVLVKMVFFLGIIIAIVYGIVYLMKRSLKVSNDNDPFLRKVSQLTISPGKSVIVVTLLNKAYLIGVTDNSISLIGEVNDDELIQSMNLYADKNDNVSKPKSFADVLEIFMPNSKFSNKESVLKNSGIMDTIRKQRERFNSGEN